MQNTGAQPFKIIQTIGLRGLFSLMPLGKSMKHFFYYCKWKSKIQKHFVLLVINAYDIL